MLDGRAGQAAVAVVPCHNEGRNPEAIADAVLRIPALRLRFLDDGSDPENRAVLDALARREPRVEVTRSPVRRGKVRSLLDAFAALETDVKSVLLLDCDVRVSAPTLQRVLGGLSDADLVVAAPAAIRPARTWWERGAIFSANRHDRLRRKAIARYPALFSNGRLLGVSRRLIDAIVAGDVPAHTEDAHFMLVCLDRGYPYSYLDDAVLWYRAPSTLPDYLRQTHRFAAGRALLRERWSESTLARWYDPRPWDLIASLAREALADPPGALAFGMMLAARAVSRPEDGARNAAWAVAGSTKAMS